MAMFARAVFFGMGVIVILAMGFPVYNIAFGVVVPLEELALMPQNLGNRVAFGLGQNPVAFQNLGPGSVHGLQTFSGKALKDFRIYLRSRHVPNLNRSFFFSP